MAFHWSFSNETELVEGLRDFPLGI